MESLARQAGPVTVQCFEIKSIRGARLMGGRVPHFARIHCTCGCLSSGESGLGPLPSRMATALAI